jgi:DNA helicase II / ATP-dependent DNA helicase PcrA
VVDYLAETTAESARAALGLLRQIVGSMCNGSIRKLGGTEEAIRVQRMQSLAHRLGTTHLIPGMTIHHAKGREWNHVGVRLFQSEQQHLIRGLSQERESDRAVYVALTRAKRSVRLV